MPRSVLQTNQPQVSNNGEETRIDQETLFKELSDDLDADLFVFSGPIERPQVSVFLDWCDRADGRTNVGLVLCTYGGDADAAYILAKFLKRVYERFSLYVFGHCKSAGTLIALGADEIIMSDRGELGPLDVQLLKTDELLFRSSGLDIAQGIRSLSEQAFDIFERNFLETIRRGGGAITTRTASEIATSLTVGLISPITGQIDPLRVGEVERAINIALQYGIRLNSDAARISRLIRDYPSHSFVIDFEEAEEVFGNVREPTDSEYLLEEVLQELIDEEGRKCIRNPHRSGIVAYLKPQKETSDEQEQKSDEAEQSASIPFDASRDAAQPRTDGGNNQRGRKSNSRRNVSQTEVAQKNESVDSNGGG